MALLSSNGNCQYITEVLNVLFTPNCFHLIVSVATNRCFSHVFSARFSTSNLFFSKRVFNTSRVPHFSVSDDMIIYSFLSIVENLKPKQSVDHICASIVGFELPNGHKKKDLYCNSRMVKSCLKRFL